MADLDTSNVADHATIAKGLMQAMTVRPASDAAAATAPLDLVFTQVKRERRINPETTFQTDFFADFQRPSLNGLLTNVSSGTNTVGLGYLTHTKLDNTNCYYTIPSVPVVPYSSIACDYVFSGDVAATNDQLRLGVYKDANNYAMVMFDNKTGKVGFSVRLDSSDRFTTTYDQTYTGYTRFAASLTGNQLTSWGFNGKVWVAFKTLDMNLYKTFTTDLSGWLWGFVMRTNGATSPRMSNLRVSPFGGVGHRDLKWVTYENGEPVIQGGEMFLTATVAAPSIVADAGSTGRSPHIGVFAYDFNARTLRQVGRLLFSETISATTTLFGGAGAKVLFDRNRGKWWVFVSTYGAAAIDVAFTEADACPLFGTQLFSALTIMPSSQNDPDLWFDGENWNMLYCQTSVHPFVVTAPTIPELVDATPVALASASNNEGGRLAVIGGQPYCMANNYDATVSGSLLVNAWPVWSLTDKSLLGYLNAPVPSNAQSAWPSIIAAPAFGGTKYVIVTFNNDDFSTTLDGAIASYCNGGIVVFESAVVAGKEYADPIRLA